MIAWGGRIIPKRETDLDADERTRARTPGDGRLRARKTMDDERQVNNNNNGVCGLSARNVVRAEDARPSAFQVHQPPPPPRHGPPDKRVPLVYVPSPPTAVAVIVVITAATAAIPRSRDNRDDRVYVRGKEKRQRQRRRTFGCRERTQCTRSLEFSCSGIGVVPGNTADTAKKSHEPREIITVRERERAALTKVFACSSTPYGPETRALYRVEEGYREKALERGADGGCWTEFRINDSVIHEINESG